MLHEIRVIFADTDAMGVVYYANYLRYFESARTAYWLGKGRTYKDFTGLGLHLPVYEAHVNYKMPARYEDLITVDVEVTELRLASLRFGYTVRRGDDLLADGFTRHAVIGPEGRPKALPAKIRALLDSTP